MAKRKEIYCKICGKKVYFSKKLEDMILANKIDVVCSYCDEKEPRHLKSYFESQTRSYDEVKRQRHTRIP